MKSRADKRVSRYMESEESKRYGDETRKNGTFLTDDVREFLIRSRQNICFLLLKDPQNLRQSLDIPRTNVYLLDA